MDAWVGLAWMLWSVAEALVGVLALGESWLVLVLVIMALLVVALFLAMLQVRASLLKTLDQIKLDVTNWCEAVKLDPVVPPPAPKPLLDRFEPCTVDPHRASPIDQLRLNWETSEAQERAELAREFRNQLRRLLIATQIELDRTTDRVFNEQRASTSPPTPAPAPSADTVVTGSLRRPDSGEDDQSPFPIGGGSKCDPSR